MNLLTEALLRVRTRTGATVMSLPELLEAHGRDDVESLTGIQRFQQEAFHVFLCSLAAAAMVRAGVTDPVQSAAFWRTALSRLSPAGDRAWELVGDDIKDVAFLQPPLPDVARLGEVPDAEAADALDLLPGKNHDLKRARAYASDPDAWVYALVSLQTMSGYYGRGWYGIARMNGGSGNRVVVELTTSLRPGRRWLDAVPRLLAHRQQVLAGPLRYDPTGIVLCWQEPWDGKTALSLEALDPFFVEVSRRVRIVERRGRLAAFTWPSHVPRIEAEALNGVVGDPWEPVDLKKPGKNGNPKVLTPGPQGLDPDLLRRLIFQDGLQMSALQSPGDDWRGDSWLVVSVLVRGQGTTDGFHERVIPIPPPVRACLFGPMERRQSLAALAKGAVEYGGKMRRFVLWPSLNTLVGAGTSTGRDADEAWAATWTRRFDRSWADDLFPWLWRQAGSPEARVLDQEWFPILRERAFAVLRGAMDSMPQRVGRRYKARAVAESEFRRRLFAKNAFADLKGAVGHDSSAAV